ncbi:DEAD/DEAH box helicase [Streptomonospora wellingtoniae]|uniref:DEAD/DEAH box helicase family protein n=1 Tax=Streptomonospora wellingtoniae TaxID=3075544 RepID=A0ABU2KNI1_9ACTN|nr:DEAD/DEAH box helicase family protein [Streptomonospora sp. DSM 45055]MDT0300713.1 DEAD/DEAH box helicase family protein [Streptomonospora sp. DSM 45055]
MDPIEESQRTSDPLFTWAKDGEVIDVVTKQSESCLRSYQANPTLIEEHANIERSITQGGYGRRQLYELIQNGADELRGANDGRIQVVLTSHALYCANKGNPVTPEGAETILASHLSRKAGAEIGRFGLGFKSVLSVSDEPRFLSRSGSFGWTRDHARRRIRERVAGDGPVPILRVARPLDPMEERRADPDLDDLMEWASTVIKLPLTDEQHAGRLALDLGNFPSAFAVFSPHVGHVILEDRRPPVATFRRDIRVSGEGSHRLLHVSESGKADKDPEKWRVFQTVHHPSAAARKAAGEYHDRPEVPLAWAVPVGRPQDTGGFWAFFPTTYETTLRGILNAPWKTNEDRQNLLKDNAFNDELMHTAAGLIVDSLPELATPGDPGLPLSLITARGRESRNWADEQLTGHVYKEAANRPSLPDQDGRLRTPAEINLQPPELTPAKERAREGRWLEQWASHPGRPSNWCHHSVLDTVRRSRAETIMGQHKAAGVEEWLEALVEDRTAAASAVAVSIVADMVKQGRAYADQARQAKILRTSQGELVAPANGEVFRRSSLDEVTSDLKFVDPELELDSDIAECLETLGVREDNAFGRFAAEVKHGVASYETDDWRRFWRLARQVGPHHVADHLREHEITPKDLRVRNRKGSFVAMTECLLPGRVIRPTDTNDHSIVLDETEHRDDLGLLRALGMSDGPRLDAAPADETWFSTYEEAMIESYYASLPSNRPRPDITRIRVDGAKPAGSLGLVRRLSRAACARFIDEIPADGVVTAWTVHAETRPNDDPHWVESPLLWVLRRDGVLNTSLGPFPVDTCVGPELAEYSRVLPVVAEIDESLSEALRLASTLERVNGKTWTAAFEYARATQSPVETGMLYALASTQLSNPGRLSCHEGQSWCEIPTMNIAVAVDEAQYRRLQAHGEPVILAPDGESAKRLVNGWGMKTFSDVYKAEYRATPVGVGTPLEDVFPLMKWKEDRPLRGLELIRCTDLERLVSTPSGQTTESATIGHAENTVFWEVQGEHDDAALLCELSRLLNLGLTDHDVSETLRNREQRKHQDFLVDVRRRTGLAEKLVAMLGRETLQEALPEGLIPAVEAEEDEVTEHMLGDLALTVYGPEVLRKFRSRLEERGFAVPAQLAGGHEARAFATDLGFPVEYAGMRQPQPDPVVTVHGPTDFRDLHLYQRHMVARVLETLRSKPAKRGLLSLPTGAGKTRVAIEALVQWLRSSPADSAPLPILWIAQTEELCEQAVQSWQYVWRHIGPPDGELTINRLWSGNEAIPVDDGFHVVVATDAKLDSVLETEAYMWLRDARAVIVDEAHVSISPRYTLVLEALGLSRHRTRCPLIGLTATPFRGTRPQEGNAEETSRLVRRYQQTRLDLDSDGSEILGVDPYAHLQELGVLSKVSHRELEGVTLDLDGGERAELEHRRRLPGSAERRLGLNSARNRRLLAAVQELPEDWPVLLFATSVAHAQIMAALLSRKGIPAASIDSKSDPGARRHTIERFGQGRIRVLANYGVLAQGFDAPATRAVIVARPTYSPNLYQQMIGRGLRGPLNGGKEECLIINVADNIANFGERLAFRDFEYLWKR